MLFRVCVCVFYVYFGLIRCHCRIWDPFVSLHRTYNTHWVSFTKSFFFFDTISLISLSVQCIFSRFFKNAAKYREEEEKLSVASQVTHQSESPIPYLSQIYFCHIYSSCSHLLLFLLDSYTFAQPLYAAHTHTHTHLSPFSIPAWLPLHFIPLLIVEQSSNV